MDTPNGYPHAGIMELKYRGWTDALIRNLLPAPTTDGASLCARVGRLWSGSGKNRFWSWGVVLKIESTIADKLAEQRAIMRKQGELTSDSTDVERIAYYRKRLKDTLVRINALVRRQNSGERTEEGKERDAMMWRVLRQSYKRLADKLAG